MFFRVSSSTFLLTSIMCIVFPPFIWYGEGGVSHDINSPSRILGLGLIFAVFLRFAIQIDYPLLASYEIMDDDLFHPNHASPLFLKFIEFVGFCLIGLATSIIFFASMISFASQQIVVAEVINVDLRRGSRGSVCFVTFKSKDIAEINRMSFRVSINQCVYARHHRFVQVKFRQNSFGQSLEIIQ